MKLKENDAMKNEAKHVVVDWLKNHMYLYWTIPVTFLFKPFNLDDALHHGWLHMYADGKEGYIMQTALNKLEELDSSLSSLEQEVLQALMDFECEPKHDTIVEWSLSHPAVSLFYFEVMDLYLSISQEALGGTELEYFEESLDDVANDEILLSIFKKVVNKYGNDKYFEEINN